VLGGIAYDLATTQAQGLEQHIKFVQQKFDLMLADRFSFEENLRCASLPHYPMIAPLPALAPLPPFITRFGINPKQLVKSLSGGQRQILAILMALQKPTQILLLDEPTAALDSKNSHMVMEFLQELVSSTAVTVLMICHNPELVRTYAKNGYFHMTVDSNQLRTIEFVQDNLENQ
jgi:ABC-type lipoprotein export system ATPase subunit